MCPQVGTHESQMIKMQFLAYGDGMRAGHMPTLKLSTGALPGPVMYVKLHSVFMASFARAPLPACHDTVHPPSSVVRSHTMNIGPHLHFVQVVQGFRGNHLASRMLSTSGPVPVDPIRNAPIHGVLDD